MAHPILVPLVRMRDLEFVKFKYEIKEYANQFVQLGADFPTEEPHHFVLIKMNGTVMHSNRSIQLFQILEKEQLTPNRTFHNCMINTSSGILYGHLKRKTDGRLVFQSNQWAAENEKVVLTAQIPHYILKHHTPIRNLID